MRKSLGRSACSAPWERDEVGKINQLSMTWREPIEKRETNFSQKRNSRRKIKANR